MNEAAKLVSDAILGDRSKVIVLGEEAFVIKAPTIAVLCRMAVPLSKVEENEKLSVGDIGTQSMLIAEAVAIASLGNDPEWKDKYPEVRDRMAQSALAELKDAFEAVSSLILAKDFFQVATWAVQVAEIAARQK